MRSVASIESSKFYKMQKQNKQISRRKYNKNKYFKNIVVLPVQ